MAFDRQMEEKFAYHPQHVQTIAAFSPPFYLCISLDDFLDLISEGPVSESTVSAVSSHME
jgi:hypothetical protein